jgi:hypothetical protein
MPGGDKVTEDESRYWVAVPQGGRTGNRLAGRVRSSKRHGPITAAQKSHGGDGGQGCGGAGYRRTKRWRAAVTYTVPSKRIEADDGFSHFGDGPVVERDGVLYVLIGGADGF